MAALMHNTSMAALVSGASESELSGYRDEPREERSSRVGADPVLTHLNSALEALETVGAESPNPGPTLDLRPTVWLHSLR